MKSAVAKVTSGEADVTIVYVTDVNAAGSKGQGVEIPDAQNVVAKYPIAIVKATHDHVPRRLRRGRGQRQRAGRAVQPRLPAAPEHARRTRLRQLGPGWCGS